MDTGVLYIGVSAVVALVGAGTWIYLSYRSRHRIAAAFDIYQDLRQTDPLFILPPGTDYQHRQWPESHLPLFHHSGILVLRRNQLEIHPYRPKLTKPLIFDMQGLCWFWHHRVTNDNEYEVPIDKLELHFHNPDDRWHLLLLTLGDSETERFMQILKSLTSLYPRNQPYSIFKPATGQIAIQDIHGGWTLGAKYQLYVSSVDLIITKGRTVVDRIPFDTIDDVRAMHRIDTRLALAGLVRFSAGGKQMAFAMTNYEDFAAALAEMAGVQLEWATERKTKKWEADSL